MKKSSYIIVLTVVSVFSFFIAGTNPAEAAVRLFGTLGYGGGATSTLVELNPDTGATIQVIGPVGYLVNGLDYDPTTNKLYGGTSINDPIFNGLIEINMTTGAGTPVGANNWGMGGPAPITNITIDSAGQMYGWYDPACDCLVSIDKNTGVATQVGPSPVGTGEYGLSFNSTDVLYLVNSGGAFYRINTSTGAATYEGSLGQTAHHGDFHPDTDLYYGLTKTYGSPRTLLRCDLAAQSCTPVGEVGNLHTLAFVYGTCTPPPSGLVSWWPGDGNASDIIGGNNGMLMNGALLAPGKVGQALSFDGMDDYVQIGAHPNLVMTNAMTVDAWIFPTGPGTPINGGIIINKEGEYEVARFPDGTIQWAFANADPGWVWINTGYVAPQDQWTHIAVVYDAGVARTYANGNLVHTYNGAGSIGDIQPSENDFRIGGRQVGDQYFKGLIDEVEIYNRALSADEILAIYNAGSGGKCKTCAPAPTGLVGWWPGEGNPSDIIGGNNGTLVGNTTYVPGRVGQAFSFDGNGDYIQVPDAANLDITNQITIDAWIKPTVLGGRIVDKIWAGGSNGYLLDTHLGKVRLIINGLGLYGSTALPLNTFTHVAGTYDGSQLKVYVNGVLDGTLSASVPIPTNDYPLRIGADQTGGNVFDGLIDEVEIFNRALSAEEIRSIYNAGSWGKCKPCTAPPSGMIGWWPGDGDANDLIDSNHGTLQGGATFAPGKVGQAFSFDGIDDYVMTPNLAGYFSDETVTIGVWFNATGPGVIIDELGQNLINYGWHDSQIEILSSGEVMVRVWNLGAVSIGTVAFGTWHHAVLRYNKATLTLDGFLDGVEATSDIIGDREAPWEYGFALYYAFGAADYTHLGSGNYFKGLIDEVGIYNRALSAEEILAIYNAGSGGKCKTCTSPPSDLVGWWPGDGYPNDIIGGNNGTMNGDATYGTGRVGQAFSFDGVNDAVKVPASPNLNVQSLTIDAWVYPETDSPMPVVEWNDEFQVGAHLWLYPSVQDIYANLVTTGYAWYQIVAYNKITLNAWNHIALTYDKPAGIATLYVNGIQVAQTNYGPLDLQTSYPLFIGRRPNDGSFNGLIDEVEIFNRALTADEIRSIYNAGLWGKCKPQGADLSITKNDSPGPVNAGATLTYTVTVSNAGPSNAVNVVVTDTLPAGVTFLSTSGCAESPGGGVPTCSLGTITANSSKQYTITVTAPNASGLITNTASVLSATFDPNTSNNSTSVGTTVLQSNLSVTKTDDPDPVIVGSPLTYTMIVTNSGPGTATGVILTEPLPGGTSFVSATSSQGTCNEAGGTVICNIGSVTNEGVVTVTIIVNAPYTKGIINNTATVTCTSTDPNLGNNSASAETTVLPHIITSTAGPHGTIYPLAPIELNHMANMKFTITPNTNYHIADVLVDDVSVGPVTEYTFIHVTTAHTIHATFAINSRTITSSAGPNGTISPLGATPVPYGSNQTFIITPNEGYHVATVRVDGDSLGPLTSYTFTNVIANHTISAVFIKNIYSLIATAGPNGSISPLGTTTVEHGNGQAYSITPNTGYHIADVLVDGTSVGPVTAHAFNNLVANHTLHAVFAIDTYTINATVEGSGNITPIGGVIVNHGSSQAFAITPDAGFVADVRIDGASIGSFATYTFTNVVANHTIHVSFLVETYNIFLPRTGQLISQAAEDDGAVQAGVIWPIPRFTNPDGTAPITESIVVDQLTGIEWTRDGNGPGPPECIPGVTKTWYEALTYISCLNANNFLGFSDWRLPNVNEMESPVDAGVPDTAAWLLSQGFSNVQAGSYWSSTTDTGMTGRAWSVDLLSGAVDSRDKSGHSLSVWPVSGMTTLPAQLWKTGQTASYFDGDDGISSQGVTWPNGRFGVETGIEADCVTDYLTGLMWVKNPDSAKRTWKNGLSYVSRLNLCGYTDWRMANRKELRSLIHYGEGDSSSWLNSTAQGFSNVQSDLYWSSTTDASDMNIAWAIDMATGELNRSDKDSSLYIFAVRGGLYLTVTPFEGTIGTEITITGANFGASKGKVWIGKVGIQVLEWTDSMIRCRLTKIMDPGVYDVKVQPKRAPAITQEEAFMMKGPQIVSIDPDKVAEGEQITVDLTGKFLGTKKGLVYLEYEVNGVLKKKNLKVLNWPTTSETGTGVGEVKVLIPASLALGTYNLVLDNKVGKTASSFTVD